MGDALLVLIYRVTLGTLPHTWTADGLYRIGYFFLFQRLAVGASDIRECHAPQVLSKGIGISLCEEFQFVTNIRTD